MGRSISAGKPLTISSTVRVHRPPSASTARHITGFGRAPNLTVRVPSGDDGPGGGVRGQRNSSMPATELSRPTARTLVPRMLPPPLKGLEKSRPSATSTRCGSSGGGSHGTQGFHCGGDWKTNCSGRSSRRTRTATARSCSQGSGCSRSSPGFQTSSGRPIGCLLLITAYYRTKEWATMQCIGQLCRSARSPKDWEVMALSTLSIAFGLKISEAVSAAPDGQVLHFTGTKGRRGQHHPEMGLWARRWGDFLARLRALAGHHPHRPAFFTAAAPSQLRSASPGRGVPLPHNALAQLAMFRGGATANAGLAAAPHPNLGQLELPSHRRLYASPPFGSSFVNPIWLVLRQRGPTACARLERQRRCALVGRNPGHIPLGFLTLDPWGLPQVLPNSGPPRLWANQQATKRKRPE